MTLASSELNSAGRRKDCCTKTVQESVAVDRDKMFTRRSGVLGGMGVLP